jgi:hypothetical protein
VPADATRATLVLSVSLGMRDVKTESVERPVAILRERK